MVGEAFKLIRLVFQILMPSMLKVQGMGACGAAMAAAYCDRNFFKIHWTGQ